MIDIFGQISKIVGRQINNITKKITRVLKLAAKPMVYLNQYVREQVKSMTRRPTSLKDYVHVFGVYISKRFLGFSVIGVVLGVLLISNFVYPWMEGRLWTPTILLNSAKMASYTGPARITNDMGTVIYYGDVANGQLTGTASQYDTEGNLVYTGEFLNARYNGYGSQYQNGVLIYEGEFADNLYSGEGTQYDETGAMIYQGGFLQGERSGTGMEYRADTHTLSYYGSFVNGVREGSGVAYEEDGVTVMYRGDFSAGLYEGSGSYYQNGALIYQGQFSQGLFEGSGTLYDAQGNMIYQGDFSKGNRQGAGTQYDGIGSALYTGTFLDGNVNYIGYLGSTPEDVAAAFGSPGYTATVGGRRVLTYLNLGTAFIFADNGEGLYTCDRVLVDIDENFLQIDRDSTTDELEALLGARFTSLELDLTAERSAAFDQLSIDVPASGRVDKYLMSTYYIKIYYDTAGERLAAVECGSY